MSESLDFSESGELLDFSSGGELALPDFSDQGVPIATAQAPRSQSEIIERRRQLERERQLVLEQEQMQSEQESFSPGKLAMRLALGAGSAGGIIEEQVGGVLASPLVARRRRETGRRMLARGAQRQEDYSELGEAVGGGPVASAAQTLGATGAASLPVLPAAIFGGLPAAAVVAGTQQFGSTFSDARERYLQETKGDVEKAEKRAFGPALLSGLVTGVVTSAFGRTGVEGITMEAIKAAGIRSVAQSVSRLIIGSGKEGVEELSDQALQSVIAKWSYRPELTLGQALEETFAAGGMGLALGGAANVFVEGTGKAAKKAGDVFEEFKADKDFKQRSIVAAQRAATLLADPEFAGDPRINRIRNVIQVKIIKPGVENAIQIESPNAVPTSEQTESRSGVGPTIPSEQPPTGAVAPEEVQGQAPVSAGTAVAPDPQVPPNVSGPALPVQAPNVPVSDPAPLPPVESVSPATAPLELQERRQKLIDGADINRSGFEDIEAAVARVNGKLDLSATHEAIRHASHGISALEFLKDAAASDDPNNSAITDRAKQILAALPKEEAKERRRRPPKDRPWDLIDEVETQLGGPISLASARKLIEDFRPIGAARRLFSAKGDSPDIALQAVGQTFRRFDSDSEFLDALNAAAQARKANRVGATEESKSLQTEEKQTVEFQEEAGVTGKKRQPIIADSLFAGDEFEISGTKLKVTSLEFDDNGEVEYVVLDDGNRYGTQRVGGQTVLNIDKGTLDKTERPKAEFLPKPDPSEQWKQIKARVKAREDRVSQFVAANPDKPFQAPLKGLAPVRQAYLVVTPSTKTKGEWQGTVFDKDGPSSDIQRKTFKEVVDQMDRDFEIDWESVRFGQTTPVPPTPTPPIRQTGGDLFGAEMPFNLMGETGQAVPEVRPEESTTGFGDQLLAQQEMFAIQRVTALNDPAKSADAAQRIHGEADAAAKALERQLAVVDSDPETKKAFGKDQRNRLKEVIALLRQRSILGKLEAMKVPTNGLHAFGIVPLVWNGAIDVAKAAVRAGAAIADAVQQAIEWIQERHEGDFEEDAARASLTATLEGRVPTQVMGGEHRVLGREQLSPETRQESIAFAGQVLQELGVTAELRQETDDRRNMQISWWRFTGTNQTEQGRRLVERLRQEIATQSDPGKSAEPLANLINSIRLNFERGMDRVFDRPTREQLYSISQGEASRRGAMLGALAGHSVDLTFVARNVDVVLHGVYSEAFGGDGLESLMRRIAELEAADPRRESDPEGTRRRAVREARRTLTAREKEVIGSKKRRWAKIEKALLEGDLYDLGSVLRTLARESGWIPPSDAEVAKLKALAEREESLRTLNSREQAEATSFGDQTRSLREKEAATLSARVALKREMATRWTRLTKPIRFWGPRDAWANRQNLAASMNELAAANLLTKLSFPTRQVISVFSQALVHLPTRAIASALMERHAAIQRGDPTGVKLLWTDILDSLRVSIRAQANAVRPALLKARAALRGRAEVKNIDAIMSGMNALDRIELKAKELKEQGKTGQAMVLMLYTQIKWGYRIAQTLDYLQGTPAEAQELLLQVHRELTEHGANRAQRMLMADQVIGSAARESALAAATTKRILEANGETPTAQEIQESAVNMLQRWQMERARAFGVPIDDFEAEASMLRNVLGWNERITRGPGGLLAVTGKGLQRIAGEAGLPLPLSAFANAIGTQVNRLLHFTPLYKLANARLPFTSEAPDPWFRTETDRQQRQVEALVGTIFFTPLLMLASMGLIVVHTRPPLDKEDRELWEKEGHKANTVEILLGDGYFIPLSLNTGPLAPAAPYLAAGGAIHKLMTERQKAQDKLNADAAKKGVAPGEIRPINTSDLLSVAASAAYGSLVGGGRTASGLAGSLSEFGQFNAQKSLASQVSPLVPGLPMLQELSRMGGVVLDQKLASFGDFMLPLPTSGARKVNLLGEPVGTPNDVQRVIQILSGGSYPGVVDAEAAKSEPAYAALFSTGYRPPTISPNKGYNINGTFRPMTDDELVRYSHERGNRLREGLLPLGATADIKSVQDVYSRANAGALRSIGARVEESDSALNLPVSSQQGGAYGSLGGTTLGSSRIGRRPSARFRTSRFSRLRRGRRPRLARGRVRTTRLRRSRGIRRLSRGLRSF